MYLKNTSSAPGEIGLSSMPIFHRSAEIADGVNGIMLWNRKTCSDCGRQYSGSHLCSGKR